MTRNPPPVEIDGIGIGMNDKCAAVNTAPDQTLMAGYNLRHAYEYSLAAFYTDGPVYKKLVIDSMKEAAKLLGYDLVKRLTPAEAHEQMIALRVAEDDRP